MKIAAISLVLFGVFLSPAQANSTEAPPPPARILIVGDSMMALTARSMGVLLDRREDVEYLVHTSLGSGLARLDVFDWMVKIDELLAAFQPDLTVAWFGANDNQPMHTGEQVVHPGTGEWMAEYTRRISLVMDKLTAESGQRVLWLELPDMRDAREQEHGGVVNGLAQEQAGPRRAVEFFPTRPLLSRRMGTYSPYIFSPEGRVIHIRAADGGHLTSGGADLVAEAVLRHIFSRTDPVR